MSYFGLGNPPYYNISDNSAYAVMLVRQYVFASVMLVKQYVPASVVLVKQYVFASVMQVTQYVLACCMLSKMLVM